MVKRKAVNIQWDIDKEETDVSLPNEIVLPDDIEDDDEISDYITDATGFCHKGYEIVEEETELKVLVVEPKKFPYMKTIDSGLKSLQHEVGGWIEALYPFEEPVALICDDESKIKEKEPNRVLRDENGKIYDVITGTFLVVGLSDEDFCSLQPEYIKKFEQMYHSPEMFIKMGERILVVPMPCSMPCSED
jgi:hypothetical protein